VQFGERRSWEDAELSGTLVVDPLSLNRLRGFDLLEHLVPVTLASEGSAKISSRFEGTWEQLRVGALVLGEKAELRYKDWLHKPYHSVVHPDDLKPTMEAVSKLSQNENILNFVNRYLGLMDAAAYQALAR